MNFLPTPASGNSVSCSMPTPDPGFWLSALRRTRQSRTVSQSLPLSPEASTFDSNNSFLSPHRHAQNPFRKRSRRNDKTMTLSTNPNTPLATLLRAKLLGEVTSAGPLCLSALHLSGARRMPALHRCDRTASELTTATNAFHVFFVLTYRQHLTFNNFRPETLPLAFVTAMPPDAPSILQNALSLLVKP